MKCNPETKKAKGTASSQRRTNNTLYRSLPPASDRSNVRSIST